MAALLKLVPWWCYLFAGMLLYIGWQVLEIHHYKASEATYKAADKTYAATQITNLATISTLQASNAKWAEAANASQVNAKEYADAVADYEVKQRSLSTAESKKLKVYYASHPLARAWSTTVVDAGVTEQLRANSGSKN